MKIKIWGSRGSMPVSGVEFNSYGGNTSAIEIMLDNGQSIMLDGGTGLGGYDRATSVEKKTNIFCMSHPHFDHVQGLPFFSGTFNPQKPLKIYGADSRGGDDLEESLAALFDGVHMPVKWDALPPHEIQLVAPGAKVEVAGATLENCPTLHPGSCVAWKITADGWTFTYTGDHEIPLDKSDIEKNEVNEKLLSFLEGSDVVLADCHFSDADRPKYPGWGHSSASQWQNALAGRDVGTLLCTHFSPAYTDEMIEDIMAKAMDGPIPCAPVYDGCLVDKAGIVERIAPSQCSACDFSRRVAAFSDTHAILDAILTTTRKLSHADAGTVYLVEDQELRFAAAQNDTLFPASAANKFMYFNSRLPLDTASIAGYVAKTGRILNIPDVYKLPPASEYSFNPSLDRSTGYRTTSVLALPLVNGNGKIIGVLQLINSMGKNGPVPFTKKMVEEISQLCQMATIPLERSFLVIDMILRILKTSALRDPTETAGHVRRVGSIAAELYHRWAEKRGIDPEELLTAKGQLRLAAMLHDVGKVGIPDAILKKPGKLDPDERARMEEHAYLGAGLFEDSPHAIDKMAGEIALHHHARWDGKGYTGNAALHTPAGEEIPIWARITAIADVYDALVSKRSYKKGWEPEKAVSILREEAGSHFDPALVEDFVEILDLVKSISARFADKDAA